ncbi:MAG: hypothetical protein K2X38_09290 [Gemmataceae bacterium]|nr:hypothetical protein [Gemmataceae bacterium]
MRILFGVGLFWLALSSAYASPTSLSVAVVVNEDSIASKMVANEYIRLRRIPSWNVVHLKLGDLDPETIDVETFRDRMLAPMLAALRERGIEKQIDTVAWSVDLPHAVRLDADMKGAKLPGIITPVAAVNGLTFLHERVLGKTPAYLSLSANGYARRQDAAQPKTAINAESVKQFQEAAQLLQKKEHAKAAEVIQEMLKEHDDHPILHYNLACALAQLGKADEALDALAKAVARGWTDRNHAQRDPDFASLKKSDRFRDILAKIRVAVPAAVPFDASQKWDEAGKKGEGNRYLLSTMLGVTTGRGNSLDETLAYLRRSVATDGSRPQGTIFYMINGDVRSRTRQWGFSAAVDALKDLGVQAEAIEGVLPKDRKDVAGLMAGSADFDWPGSTSSILPGAICEHLTSFGGVMHWGAGQTPISEFLRHGASGSSGAVTEPYAIQNKFPTPFIHVYYAQGYSLAEAFYLSVQGPYQLLIIGDPLCRPWSPSGKMIVEGWTGESPEKAIKLTPKWEGLEAQRFEFHLDGKLQESIKPGESITVDPKTMNDGWHNLAIVAFAKDQAQSPRIWQQGMRVGDMPKLELGSTLPITLDKTVDLRLSGPDAESVDLMCQGRKLASSAESKGSFTIPAAVVGPGKVEVQAIARRGKQTIASKPLALDIALLSFAAQPQPKDARPGLRWTDSDGAAWRLTKLADAKLEAKKADASFNIEGWLEVKETSTWQFDLRRTNSAKILLDGKELTTTRHQAMKLDLGWRHLRIEGKGQPNQLDIRFGSRGLPPLDVHAWRHTGETRDLPATDKK